SARFSAIVSFFALLPLPPRSTLFPYTTLFRSTVVHQDLRVPRWPGLGTAHAGAAGQVIRAEPQVGCGEGAHRFGPGSHHLLHPRDRKSTRLNSSHVSISYAVFCLKKKTHTSNH